MNIRLYHYTEYTFSNAVFIEPHILKFKPRLDPRQQLLNFDLKVSPEPAGRYEFFDESGNLSELVWFNGDHPNLIIEARSKLRLNQLDPFGFLIYPFHHNQMPIQYSSSNGLDIYLQNDVNQIDTYDYAKLLLKEYGRNTMDFLLAVTKNLHEEIEKTVRHSGSPHPPDKTLKDKEGSCRDLAVLEIEILRKAGFASRFVSGYKFNDEEDNHELHAWVEVYIHGPGWMGLDPSSGLVVGNDHIPVSSSFLAMNTLPVSGSFRGTAKSSMDSTIRIEKIQN